MDIISMQIANKVLRRMNENYNGMHDAQIAIAGQTEFTTVVSFGKGHNTLSVFVDGAHAYNKTDYEEVDNRTIKFAVPFEGGEIVLFRTSVAGNPVYNGKDFDDTAIIESVQQVTASIATLTESIASNKSEIEVIYAALDDNEDGSILDTIGNIIAAWEAADGDIKVLINDKASNADVLALNSEVVNARGGFETMVQNLESFTAAIAKTDLAVVALEESFVSLEARLVALETAEVVPSAELIMNDESTGFGYKVKINNGLLVAELITILTKVVLTKTTEDEVVVGSEVEFKAAAEYQDASASVALVEFSVDTEDFATIDISTGILTATAPGTVTVTAKATETEILVQDSLVIVIGKNDTMHVNELAGSLDLAALNSLSDLDFVENDLTLPAEVVLADKTGTIVWATDNAVVISDAGIVTRPLNEETDVVVTLTATITLNEAVTTKDFVVNVLKEAI